MKVNNKFNTELLAFIKNHSMVNNSDGIHAIKSKLGTYHIDGMYEFTLNDKSAENCISVYLTVNAARRIVKTDTINLSDIIKISTSINKIDPIDFDEFFKNVKKYDKFLTALSKFISTFTVADITDLTKENK